jgi:hypothetical protein
MKPNRPGTEAKTHKDPAAPDKACDQSPTGVSGGAHAEEEDIGTEGAGTEPRQNADVKRETGSSSTKARTSKSGS